MYFGKEQTDSWVRAINSLCESHPAVTSGVVEPFVIPSFLGIPGAVEITTGSAVNVGAQNMHWQAPGPYTGEVCSRDLIEYGVQLVEIGHSERRQMFGEDDEIVSLKVAAALNSGLIPLLCIGENEELVADQAADACVSMLDKSLARARSEGASGRIIVAYEPVWAIGKSLPAGEQHICTVTNRLREYLDSDRSLAPTQVIYGGSAGPGLLTRIADDIDGLFLGRFSHDPDAFGEILDEALRAIE